jgi:DNA modification methylase
MFSVKGDTVLDPFLGSGTTTRVAVETERNSVGYEREESLLPLIKNKIGSVSHKETFAPYKLEIARRADAP